MNTPQLTQPTVKRNLMMSMIALSMGGMSLSTQAQTQLPSKQSQEVEQLRQEVQALRELIEQQKVQTAQTATAIAAACAKRLLFPTTNVSKVYFGLRVLFEVSISGS